MEISDYDEINVTAVTFTLFPTEIIAALDGVIIHEFMNFNRAHFRS